MEAPEHRPTALAVPAQDRIAPLVIPLPIGILLPPKARALSLLPYHDSLSIVLLQGSMSISDST